MELKVQVPTALSEITLEQYQRFIRLEGDEEFITTKMLEIFCGVPLDKLPSVRFTDVSNVYPHITGMLSERPSINLKPTIEGTQFGFIPNLEEITYGEFVDLDNYLRDETTLHKAMAVLYRPIERTAGKRYEIEPYDSSDKYSETMKKCPMDVAMGATLFFWTLGSELVNATLSSSQGEEMIGLLKRSLGKNGGGTPPSISSLKAILGDLTMFQNSPSTNASPS